MELTDDRRALIKEMVAAMDNMVGVTAYSMKSLFEVESVSKLVILKIDTLTNKVVVAERCLDKFLTDKSVVINRIHRVPIERISEHLLTREEFIEKVATAAGVTYMSTSISGISKKEFVDEVVAKAIHEVDKL